MGATIGAALKKVAVAILTDEKTLKKVGMILLTLFVALILPVCAFLALVSGKIKLDVGMLQQQIIENLSAEDRAMLESIESMMEEIKSAFTEADMPERAGEAQAAYIMALYNQAKEPGFVSRLLGLLPERFDRPANRGYAEPDFRLQNYN